MILTLLWLFKTGRADPILLFSGQGQNYLVDFEETFFHGGNLDQEVWLRDKSVTHSFQNISTSQR